MHAASALRGIAPASLLCLLAASFAAGQEPSAPSAAESPPAAPDALERKLPEPLAPWQDWALWNDRLRDCPPTYASADDRICVWPAVLDLRAGDQGGSFAGRVTVFARCWAALPGGGEVWPTKVSVDGAPAVVVEREGRPAIELEPGSHAVTGEFVWDEQPEHIALPPAIGLLALTVGDEAIPLPEWDEQGFVWLRRTRAAEAAEDSLAVQVFRLLEDGIPLWLNTEIELTVSGQNREETLGWALPEGWQLATIDSPIPVAVDERGVAKAQVRAGKWTVRLRAFRTDDARTFQYAADAQPIIDVELLGMRGNPTFRLAQLAGLQAVDASQTAYPSAWRDAQVYQWPTNQPFQLEEKVRGMGAQRPEGLRIERTLWLDVEGPAPLLTYRDRVTGNRQQVWRLDAAAGQKLGRVRIGGEGQLITANPETGAAGVEVRTRDLQLEAIGTAPLTQELPATGWQTDADALEVTLTLPPGWRALAVLGADRVDGDWLTAWTLLDLFLVLIFALAAFRLWGLWAGVVAFLGFGLTYHELGAPRITWLFLLIPAAILSTGPTGALRRWVVRWKLAAAALLLVNLVPFVAAQFQAALYPQLELPGVQYGPRPMFGGVGRAYRMAGAASEAMLESNELAPGKGAFLGRPMAPQQQQQMARFNASNLGYDPQAQIQTGPAEPMWSWNQVHCAWDGPVAASQQIRPVLVTLSQHRVLTLARVALALILAALLLGARRGLGGAVRRAVPAAAVLAAAGCLALGPPATAAEFPSGELLERLRERLLEPDDAFPQAADIAACTLRVAENRVTLEAEIHAAHQVAVPLPGRVAAWSPVAVSVDGQAAEWVCRRDGYLWVLLPEGVHRVTLEALLPDVNEWAWTFVLRPRRVAVEAPGWAVAGLRPNGQVDSQLVFSRQRTAPAGEAAYNRNDVSAMVVVDRYLEIGLIWQVRTEITRLAAPRKAVSLQVPLLPGEKVLSPGMTVRDGKLEANLGAGQDTFAWASELPVGAPLTLQAAAADPSANDRWVERWHLAASPMWHAAYEGLAPVYEADESNLVPVWLPWPGEQVQLAFGRPAAVGGETVTVQQVQYETTLGSRHRTAVLKLDVDASMGADFAVVLPEDLDISALTIGGQATPVRRDGPRLIVPITPGKQSVEVQWRADQPLETWAAVAPVELPVDAANCTAVLRVPESRWVLWTTGPLRGPAVQFWTLLGLAVLAAIILGSLPYSPLRRWEWVLLVLGLTQVHVAPALLVVGWLFLLAYRGRQDPDAVAFWRFDLMQLALAAITLAALGVLIAAVGQGLLGSPEMFIRGNGSSQTQLQWFQPNSGPQLPQPAVASISIWWYRLLMLAWALWLAAALLRWLQWGWQQFNHRGVWRRGSLLSAGPPSPP